MDSIIMLLTLICITQWSMCSMAKDYTCPLRQVHCWTVDEHLQSCMIIIIIHDYYVTIV